MYSLPGMQLYPINVDGPSGYNDMGAVTTNPLTGSQHAGVNVSGSYSGGVDVPAFVMIFAGAALGLWVFLHVLSTGRIKL